MKGVLALGALLLCTACGPPGNIVIGSKNFTEQVLLGELLAQQIERSTELTVDRRLNLGGTFICDTALRAGEIDGYVEYTGTALTAILKREPVQDRGEAYRTVASAYASARLSWLEPLGFNNTFAIIVRRREASRLGISTISEAARFTPRWRAGFGYEFIERADGFKGLSRTYGLSFAGAPRVMELGLMYRALADGEVDLIAGDATAGLIEALNLAVLEDDRNYFPPYDAVPVFRTDTLERHPRLAGVINALADSIDESEMRRLNYLVEGEGRDVKAVCREFLARLNPQS